MRMFNNTYSVFKTVFVNNSSSWSLYQKLGASPNTRYLWTGNQSFVYHAFVDSGSYADYSSSLESIASTVLEEDDALASLVGLATIRDTFQEDNAMRVTLVGRRGDEKIFSTHNFADKTTWFSESVQVVTESLSNSGDNLTFSSSNEYWIDLRHGKMHAEDTWNAGGTYNVTVTVDGEEKTECVCWNGVIDPGYDYRVDYRSGSVIFATEQTGSVKASYHYAAGSAFILKPDPGKEIEIEDAEAQFSSDTEYNSGILFRVYGPIAIFAPFLMQSNGGPYPDDTKIPLDEEEFKSMHQIIDEAKGAYPIIPAIGGPRGMTSDMHGFPFRYGTIRALKSSLGLDLRISVRDDIPFGGERSTATFYSVIIDE